MRYLLEFIQTENPEKSSVFEHLKCSPEEARILQTVTRHYVEGSEESGVVELLGELYGDEAYGYVKHLGKIRSLLELGWLVQNSFHSIKLGELSTLEMLHTSVTPSVALLKLLENGSLDLMLPEVTPYTDHLEYLQDQFLRIDLYAKMGVPRHGHTSASASSSRLQNKLGLLEKRIQERVAVTKEPIVVEEFFKEKGLDAKEQIIFLALLKEEYAGGEGNLRDMNTLIDIVSYDEYDRFKNRALLEEGAKLVSEEIIDYDEMLNPFGGITRSFFINEEVLHDIIHPQKKKKRTKLKLDMLVKEQDIFELIDPKTSLDDVVLHPQTREILDSLLKQMDKKVSSRLKEWGIRPRARGIDARIIFYGPPGTGKTELALNLAQACQASCYQVAMSDEQGGSLLGNDRFDSYRLAQNILSNESNTMIIFDEAEDVFGCADRSDLMVVIDDTAKSRSKAWVNLALEGNLVPTIWITNNIYSIDKAIVRRFDFVCEVPIPNKKQRRKIIQKYSDGLLEPKEIKRLAKNKLIAPAIVSRAAKVVSSLDTNKRYKVFAHIINNTLKAQRHPELLLSKKKDKKEKNSLPSVYRPEFINTSTDLEELVEGVKKHPNARMCF